MENQNYTIKDIAQLAGVSAGTVDRVLHDRGEVSAASKEKVKKVLDEINYQPNMFAIGLAAKKKYTICCFIPSHLKRGYWSSVAEGIERAAKELNPFNVQIEYMCYTHSDKASFIQKGRELLDKHPDAVLIAPNFRGETLNIAEQLTDASIPYVFIDVNIEGANALKYIGQDSFQSGYIAAKILMYEYKEGRELVMFLGSERNNPAEVQMQRRMSGFLKYIEESHCGVKAHEVILNGETYEDNKSILDNFFNKHPKACIGVTFNSRVYTTARFLQEVGIKMERLIGYDLLPPNVELLKAGVVTYLIGQRPELQGYCGVKSLVDKIVFKKEIVPVKYMPIDVLMKDNIDYYFEFI